MTAKITAKTLERSHLKRVGGYQRYVKKTIAYITYVLVKLHGR